MSLLDSSFAPQRSDERPPRKRQLIRAVLMDSARQRHDIVIRNVSERGLGGTTLGTPLKKGESVTIVLSDDTMVDGAIAWVDGEKFGVRLWNEMDLHTLADIVRQKQPTDSQQGAWEVQRAHRVYTPVPQQGALRRI